MQPAVYWRNNKNWKKWLGKIGKIIASTQIQVTSPELVAHVPYCLAIIDFGGIKQTMMGVGHEELNPGDQVKCVLRKIAIPSKSELIPYVIKVKKII